MPTKVIITGCIMNKILMTDLKLLKMENVTNSLNFYLISRKQCHIIQAWSGARKQAIHHLIKRYITTFI